jgi:hypothetical protein
MSLALWRNAHFVSDNPPKNRYHNLGGVRVLLLIFIGVFFFLKSEKIAFFSSENAFKCFNRLLLKFGTAGYVPPLPRPGVQLQVVL